MRKLGFHPVVILLPLLAVTLYAQTTGRPRPGFTLSIEDDKSLPGDYPFGYHRLLVTYTNISDRDDIHTVMDSEDMLNMIVLLDGVPAEEKEGMRQLRRSREALASGHWMGSLQMPKPLKPGKSVKIPLYISDYFDTTKPGTYTITVNRETFPWEPEKSVTVWSNTIEIVVPKPQAVAPK
jgi:hypothetical protein